MKQQQIFSVQNINLIVFKVIFSGGIINFISLQLL